MPAQLPIAAGIGIEGIIWLIILIFWGIAQAVQKSRNARRPGGPAAPGRPAAPFDDELREMLEQLSGRSAAPERGEFVEEIELEDERPAPPPPPRPKPPPPPRREPRPPRPVQHAHARPPQRPSRPLPPIEPLEPGAIPEMAAAISAEDFAAASASLRSGLNAPGLSMRMKGMRMQGIATMPSGNPSGRHGAPLLTLRDLRDERQLRRAILAKAILDPPRGLVPYGRAL